MFSSLYKIRVEAGILFEQRAESLYDVNRNAPVSGDGNTLVFYTKHAPIVDSDQDDDEDTSDVVFRVEGSAVTVSSIDASQGKITLAAAPALDDELDIDYAWSSHSDSQVQIYQNRAYGRIISAIGAVYDLPIADVSINPDFADSPAAYLLESLETVLAAGLLLTTIYTEENGGLYEEGRGKIKMVESTLKDIKNGVVQLFDSEELELAKTNNNRPAGYPNNATAANEDYAFKKTTVL